MQSAIGTHMTAEAAAHLALYSTFTFPQGQNHHVKSMGKHRILKEINTFIAVAEAVTSDPSRVLPF